MACAYIAHILVFLQFLHSTSAATLHSFTVCPELPHRLHFPLKNASACSLLGEGLAWHGFWAWLFLEAWLGFFVTLSALLSPFCSSHLSDLSQPVASLCMNCQLTYSPWRRRYFLNLVEGQPQMKIIAMISCWVISFSSFRPLGRRSCSSTVPLILPVLVGA